MTEPPRIALVTVSDGVVAGTRADASGDALQQWVAERAAVLVQRTSVADDVDAIVQALLPLCDVARADVILTTGGTGLTARDVTPEATRAVIDREAPGIAEQIRTVGNAATPYSALSRGIAGMRGSTLIINLPGSAGGVRDGLRVLDELIDHAVQLLRGHETHRHDITRS
jgi:molybdenum cofactor synthesis domain-containing protein